jgi:ESS family glutamate:Na+ symporter
MIISVLLGALLAGNTLKRKIPFLKKSLMPSSVIGGTLLIIIAAIYKAIAGEVMFDTAIFDYKGTAFLEMITYHTLALGFIASTLKITDSHLNKQRTTEIINTGITTVATYLIQGVIGIAITMVAALIIKDFFSAAGMLLPFGFGQGTGQAMNYGNIYETEYGFIGGKSFGLTIAALGFLSASFGGVIHLNVMKKNGKIKITDNSQAISSESVEGRNEIPMQESLDKISVQIAFIFVSYAIAYLFMYLLGLIIPGMKSTIYGFNFLLGVLCATLVKFATRFLRKSKLMNREYINNFLLTRLSNFFFDIMIVAGIAAIRLDILERYWGIALVLGGVGLVITYAYNRIVAKKLFKDYEEEQFLAMYGMLTGTASTGMILLREVDGEFKTPAADNLVYQNFPAIILGFPMLILATLAPKNPILTLVIMLASFILLNVILFRGFIFRKRGKSGNESKK